MHRDFKYHHKGINRLAWIICALGGFFYCYETLLRVSPDVLMGPLMKAYHINAANYGNISACYYYTYVPMQVIVGVLMDRYGPRLLLSLATLLCALGSFLFVCSDIFALAIIGRLIIGVGSAFAFIGVLKLATIWHPPRRFPLISGLVLTLGMLGGMLGDAGLNFFVSHLGWKETLYYSAVFGTILGGLIWFIVRNEKPMYRISHYKPQKKYSRKDLFNVLKNKQIWLIGIIGAITYMPISIFAELWGNQFLIQAHHFHSQDAANITTGIFCSWAIGCPIMGWLAERYLKRKTLLFWGSLVAAIIFCVTLYSPTMSYMSYQILLFLFGFASSTQVLVFSLGKDNATNRAAGTAISFVNMFVMLAGAVLQPTIGHILDHTKYHVINHVYIYNTHAYQLALSILPVCIFIAGLLSLFIQEANFCVYKPVKTTDR